MAVHIILFTKPEHPGRSLVARVGLTRTFGNLAWFLAITFLGFGVYILADAFANPIAGQSGALHTAAVIIAPWINYSVLPTQAPETVGYRRTPIQASPAPWFKGRRQNLWTD